MTSVEVNRESCRERFLGTIRRIFESDNALSKCCAVRALERMKSRDGASKKWLTDLLIDADADVRMDAAAALGRMRIGEAVQPLLSSLTGDPEGEVRIQAVVALSRIASGKTVEPLIDCLKEDGYPQLDLATDDMAYSSCWEVQSQALDALGEIGDRRATQAIIEFLKSDGYEDIQESGCRVLAKLDSDKAREFLLDRLTQGNALARRQATRALGCLPELAAGNGEAPPDVLEGLLQALLDKEPQVRSAAADVLGRIHDPRVIVPLTLLLNDPDAKVREDVAVILVGMRGGDIVERLHDLLEDPELPSKQGIVRVLGEIGDAASFRPLSRLLDATMDEDLPDESLLYGLIRALENVGQAGAEEKIAAVLADRQANFALRTQAALTLGVLLSITAGADNDAEARNDDEKTAADEAQASPTPEEILHAFLFDENESIVFAVLSSLVKIDTQAAPHMLTALILGDLCPVEDGAAGEGAEEGTPSREDSSPGRAEDRSAVRALPDLPDGGDPGHSTLGSILAATAHEPVPGVEEVDQPDQAAAVSSGPDVRGVRRDRVHIHAARLLGGIADPGPEAVSALMKLAGGDAPELRREALLSLGRIGDGQALGVILPALDAEQLEVRLAALEALDRIDCEFDMNETLTRLLGDPDPVIREKMVRVLGAAPGAETILHLCRAMNDESSDVCRAALEAVTGEMACRDLREHITQTMFRFGGDLRKEAGAALGRIGDASGAMALFEVLDDEEREEFHWICIDALAEMYAHGAPVGGQNGQEGNHED